MTRGRSVARKCAMQALYQWQLGAQAAEEIQQQFASSEDLDGADKDYFGELLRECIARHEALDSALTTFIDRPLEQLDPVEHAILLVGMYELQERIDVPYRVVINEGVALSKRFGATDGHRYVNAVLDKAARAIRTAEQGA
ncbi:MAG: transcription antitermination factor NusB [Candidatus Obscuribacterales bacterium]|nr:transcription antitermination factor NusB [Steroidobacteraceae bacterium]